MKPQLSRFDVLWCFFSVGIFQLFGIEITAVLGCFGVYLCAEFAS